jgi:hypothetical protein
MVQTLTEIIGDSEKRASLVAAGIERLQLYSWEKATRTEKVYQKVLNETLNPKTSIK